MAFHFKTRISTLEKKNNALAEMCTTIVAKISQVKQMVVMQNTGTMMPMEPNIYFRSQNNTAATCVEVIDSESEESESDSESEESESEESESESVDKEEECEILLDDLKVEEEPSPHHLETSDLQSEVFSQAITHENAFKKMSVQMLRTLVISKGLCTDPSKMKKLDLLKMLEEV